MRRYTQIVFTLLMLFVSGANKVWADDVTANEIIINTNANGTLTASVDKYASDDPNGKYKAGDYKVTLTATPQPGYTLKKDDITVQPMVNPNASPQLHAPGTGIGISELPVTEESANVFSFILSQNYHGAYVTATFTQAELTLIESLGEITDQYGRYKIKDDVTEVSGTPGVTEFKGEFDGNLATFSLNAPLFDVVNGGIVKNVIVKEGTISGNGAIANKVIGTSNRIAVIYNCGMLGSVVKNYDSTTGKLISVFYGSSVSGSGSVGGLVGQLGEPGNTPETNAQCYARVINCYSFAQVSGGSGTTGGIVGQNCYSSKTNDIRSMVMNCMFYGTGNGISPIYGGLEISNTDDSKLNNYNYFCYENLSTENIYKFEGDYKYNCALAAEERFLVRFEFYRQLLNSTRELAAYYVGATLPDLTTGEKRYDKSQIAKWVLDKSVAPYPILKKQGYYPSVVNNISATTSSADNSSVVDYSASIAPETPEAQTTLDVYFNGTKYTLPITDKDPNNFNYCYHKVQLPYYNDLASDNYTIKDGKSKVVTGWEITFNDGTEGSFTKDEYDVTFSGTDANGNPKITKTPYNYADRSTYAKDLAANQIYSQGAYFNVPDGVTSINITPHWATAVYLSDPYYDSYGYNGNSTVDNNYVTNAVEDFGIRFKEKTDDKYTKYSINGSSQTVYTKISDAIGALPTTGTVYDNAVVLVGNYHKGGNSELSNGNKSFTIMSIDLDKDNEPDYSLIFRSYKQQQVCPIRYDFINVPGMAMAHKTASDDNMAIPANCKPKGWFEITNTALIRYNQFEYDNNTKSTAGNPLILLGGVIEQFVSTNYANDGENPDHTTNIYLGGNVWFKLFSNGVHADKGANKTPHRPISVTGGEYETFYLSGYFRPDSPYFTDDAECYIDGGKFGEVAGAGQEKIDGNVTWIINHADIKDFYGGGINPGQPISGNIYVSIKNSHIDKYCGGPKFGNMAEDKTVTTIANHCEFGTYYGAGNGGTALVRYRTFNKWDNANYSWNTGSTMVGGFTNGNDKRGKYDASKGGISVSYEYEHFEGSGANTVGRFYVNYASLSLAQTNNVKSELTDCDITGSFYGGGNLGKVDGDATSILKGCRVQGSVYGAGYSATAPTAEVFPAEGFTNNTTASPKPYYNVKTGVFEKGEYPKAVKFTWSNTTEAISSSNSLDESNLLIRVYYNPTTKEGINLKELGTVTGKVTLNIEDYKDDNNEIKTNITGSVYGGGQSSDATGDVEVNVIGGSMADVYGGGEGQTTVVGGDVTVNIGALKKGTTDTYEGTATISGSVYGGSALGAVNATKTTTGTTTTLSNPNNKNTNVNVFKGTVNGSVFGGGLGQKEGVLSATEDIVAKVLGNSTVTIGAATSTESKAAPTIKGSVFGGSNVNGVSEKDATVKVVSGTVGPATPSNPAVTSEGDVHGGGLGQPTLVQGSVTVTIGDKTDETTPTYYGFADIKGNVYGGSAKGNVNTTDGTSVTTGATTHVNLYGCTNVNDIYGGGLGDNTTDKEVAANVYGPVTVTVEGGTAQNVFGCNNLYGAPQSTVVVNVNGTADAGVGNVYGGGNLAVYSGSPEVNINNGTITGNVYGGGNGDSADATQTLGSTAASTVTIGDLTTGHEAYQAIVQGDVYGGGNAAKVTGTTAPAVLVQKCNTQVGYVYGGGNAADVPATNVTVSGGIISHDVFGGGHGDNTQDNEKAANVNGNVSVSVTGGKMDRVFAGSNLNGTISGTVTLNIDKADGACDMMIGEVYGGGNQAAGNAATVTIGCTGTLATLDEGERYGYEKEGIGAVYGGANQADIGTADSNSDITVTINSGIVANVYGGNNISGDIYGTITVNINKTSDACGWYIGNVYGGGNLATYSVENIDKNRTDLDFSTASESTYYKNYPKVNILAGDVSGDVYGGGLGDVTDATKGVVTGNPIVTLTDGSARNIYGGGKAANIDGSTLVKVEGGSVTADVYGGGEGSTTNITGNVEVRIGKDESGTYSGTATIGGDVYGGSAFGKVNDNGTTTPGATTVDLYAGAITGKVFGGGKGDAAANGAEAFVYGKSTVSLYSATVGAGIFGGCNDRGTMNGDVQIDLKGGTIGTESTSANVYGGGYGNNTYIEGSVEVNVGTSGQSTEGTTIWGDVYGGGAMGHVNAIKNTMEGATEPTYTANTTTDVNLYKGLIKGNVYGGGHGLSDTPAYVGGDVTVTLDGATLNPTFEAGVTLAEEEGGDDKIAVAKTGQIFGGNNLKGTPKGHVKVHVKQTVTATETGTALKTAHASTSGDDDYAAVKAAIKSYEAAGDIWCDVAAVYGGGNQADYVPTATNDYTEVVIDVDGCDATSIKSVYGGGNAAATPETKVYIKGSYFVKYVFGGGNGVSYGSYVNPGANVGQKTNSTDTYGAGKAKVELVGGRVGYVYGGSNSKGNIKNGTDVSKSKTTNTCALKVSGIYGAGKNADMEGGTTVNIDCIDGLDYVYGGAMNANVSGGVRVIVTGGHYKKVFGGNNISGTIQGPIKVFIEEGECGPLEIDELYLGGNQAAYSVYGYYKDATDGNKLKPRKADDTEEDKPHEGVTAVPYAAPELNIVSCTKIGKVFGGGLGSTATMYGSPTVNINQALGDQASAIGGKLGQIGADYTDNSTTLKGGIYGGGWEAAVYGDATVNICTPNTYISGGEIALQSQEDTKKKVLGAKIVSNVYGGGLAANVFGNTTVNIGTANYSSNDGYEGLNINGSIFGGGEGNTTLVSGNVEVNIGAAGAGDAVITGNVYGGSAMGKVNSADGTTVNTYTDPTDATQTDNCYTQVNLYGGSISGNVYGGGYGKDDATGTVYAADVYGGVTVSIEGGTVEKDVYGGGALASTNVGNTTATNSGTETAPVWTYPNNTAVNLNGGIIKGDVYGGGLGRAEATGVTEVAALVKGGVTVTLNGTKLKTGYTEGENPVVNAGRVFGCNNVKGTPQGHVKVLVQKTSALSASDLGSATQPIDVGAVFGGGNQAAYEPANANDYAEVEINKSTGDDAHVTVGNVFGGGNEAGIGNTTTTASTLVKLVSGDVKSGIYGGCNTSGTVSKNTTVTLTGGKVGDGTVSDAGVISYTDNTKAYVHGGGYGASTVVSGDVNVNIGEGTTGSAVVWGNVFGGSALGKVNGEAANAERSTTITFVSGTVNGDVFGGGLGTSADVYGSTYVKMSGGTAGSVYGGGDAAPVECNANVTLSGTAQVNGNVFGGGNQAIVNGSTTVNIKETQE